MARFLATDPGMARNANPALANPAHVDRERVARLHEAAVRQAQRLRRCAILEWQDAVVGALVRALVRPFRGTGPALRVPSGSVRTPPQRSRCAA
jgi:hypothetical protein